MCDRRGLLLAEPFSVSVSASNVVVRIRLKDHEVAERRFIFSACRLSS